MKSNGKISVGVIGYGIRGENIVNSVFANGNYEVKCIVDSNKKVLDKGRDKYPFFKEIQIYTDYRKLLEREDIEAVFVTIPQFVHCQVTVDALKAGKHVYCEKPMALTIKECDRMIDTSKKTGKILMVGQQMRYHGHLKGMKKIIDQGTIGKIVMLWLKEFRDPFSEREWLYNKEKSGGLLVEKNCHHTDFFNWMAGSKPISVFASGGQDVLQQKALGKIRKGVMDNAWVIVNYENGARAVLGICMFAAVSHEYGIHRREMGVVGDKGMVRTEGELGRNLEISFRDSKDKVLYQMDISKNVGEQGILDGFYLSIRKGIKPEVSGEIGKMAVAVSLAAERSAEEKRLVKISEVL